MLVQKSLWLLSLKVKVKNAITFVPTSTFLFSDFQWTTGSSYDSQTKGNMVNFNAANVVLGVYLQVSFVEKRCPNIVNSGMSS